MKYRNRKTDKATVSYGSIHQLSEPDDGPPDSDGTAYDGDVVERRAYLSQRDLAMFFSGLGCGVLAAIFAVSLPLLPWSEWVDTVYWFARWMTGL